MIARVAKEFGGYSVFAGVGERTREGNDLWREMQETAMGSGEGYVIDNTVMVFGQMNEPPGARLRVALTGLTMAEWFRDTTGKDTLFFVDNIFRFSQAGSEVSALLGRMPSAVGYQPTLGTEQGQLQERIVSTKKRRHHFSVQAVYVPADDPTDPGSGDRVRPPRRLHLPGPEDQREGHLPPPSTRWPPTVGFSTRRSSASGTLRSPPRCSGSSSVTANCRTLLRSSGWTSCPRTTSRR